MTAPYSSVDCIVAVEPFFMILALISDSKLITLSIFIFLPVFCLSQSTCFLKFSVLSMMI